MPLPESPHPANGLFVTFEGIDGSGKSTQLDLCAESLRAVGKSVVVTRNPGGTAFGAELRQILLHTEHPVGSMPELLLFMADRAQHINEVVLPALSRGEIVLCDRHVDSTVAYQGYGRGLPVEMILSLNALATGGRNPDITLLFDGDPAVLARRVTRRGKADRLEGESLAFRQRVRDGYLALAAENPGRLIRLNAEESVDALHQKVMSILEGNA